MNPDAHLNCSVYWIHLKNHTNITSEGYIGITTQDIFKRFSDHKHYAKTKGDYPLSKAILKYGDELQIKVLVHGSKEYCLEVERKLRPTKRIGWNLMEGGGFTPNQTGRKHSEESKKKISEASKRTKYTPAKLAAYQRAKGIKRPDHVGLAIKLSKALLKPWERSRSNKDIWVRADEIFKAHLDNPEFGHINLEKFLGLKKKSLQNIYDKITKQHWNPLQDQEWSEWSKNFKLNKLNKGN